MKYLGNSSDVNGFFEGYPLIASSLRLTMACNAKCAHCYTDGGKKLDREFSLEEIKNIIDQLHEAGIFQIFFTGGEPFLRKDIVEILQYANSKEIEVLISTNGSVLKEEVVKQVSNIRFKQFQVSIDGMADYHNHNRGNQMFEKADQAIDLLTKYKIENITIGMCITKNNERELPDVINYALKKQVSKLAVMLLLPAGRATISMDVDVESLLHYLGEFWEIYRKNKDKIGFAENSVLPPTLVPKDLRELGVHKKFEMCCSYPNIIGIGADGKVAPCDGFLNWKEYEMGDVKETSIKDIWKKYSMGKTKVPNEILKISGICQKCVYLKQCAGNCRADSYAYYKDLLAPYPICQMLYDKKIFPKDCLINAPVLA